MRRRHGVLWRAAAALAPCLALPDAVAAAVLDQLQGAWAARPADQPAMEWSASGDAFSVSFTPPAGKPITIQFTPSGRPGVLAGHAKAGWSMMGAMFGGDEPVDPLVEGTLYWARTAEDAVYFYSLAIDDQGAFELDRYRCMPEGDGLTVSIQRRSAGGAVDVPEQHLVRVGS